MGNKAKTLGELVGFFSLVSAGLLSIHYALNFTSEKNRKEEVAKWESEHSRFVRTSWDNIPYQIREYTWSTPRIITETNNSFESPYRH